MTYETWKSRLIYEPDQAEGHYHEGFVVVRNPSNQPVQIEGQVSIKDSGRLVKSYAPSTVVLPRSRGVLIEEAIDLPRPPRRRSTRPPPAALPPQPQQPEDLPAISELHAASLTQELGIEVHPTKRALRSIALDDPRRPPSGALRLSWIH